MENSGQPRSLHHGLSYAPSICTVPEKVDSGSNTSKRNEFLLEIINVMNEVNPETS